MAIRIKYTAYRFNAPEPTKAVYDLLKFTSDDAFKADLKQQKWIAWKEASKRGPWILIPIGLGLILFGFLVDAAFVRTDQFGQRHGAPDWIVDGPYIVGIIAIILSFLTAVFEQQSYYFAATKHVNYRRFLREQAKGSRSFDEFSARVDSQKESWR